MDKLEVYTMEDCPKCPMAKELCEDIAKELNLSFETKSIEENMIEALQLQIASAPSIVLGDSVLYRSTIPERDELINKINKRRGND